MAGAGHCRQHEAGSALLIVLWLSLLLSTILLATAVIVQTQLAAARQARTTVASDEVLRSALDIAAFDLALAGRPGLGDFPRTISIGDQSVTVRVRPPRATLDINLANDDDWIALFTQLGETPQDARRFADRILDWRDADAIPRAYGDEGRSGNHGGDGGQVANRPFVSVAELAMVRGISVARMNCLRPYLTVLGGTPPPRLETVAGADAATADGMRVAFEARLMSSDDRVETLTGLALYRAAHRRPFEWVSFGDDAPQFDRCGPDGGVSTG